MRLSQHIYGRVTRGIELSGAGFQLAASSPSLRGNAELVKTLNRFSFGRPWKGPGPADRYSFFRPATGWLAFGCARVAKDLSGAVGSFGHNYVCEERDFLASAVSPLALLRSLTFLKSEAELPTRRDLDTVEVPDEPATPSSHPEWRAATEELASIYLGESAMVVPMVVIDPAHMWDLLEELFGLLPRLEAARLLFSTLFVEANDFVEGYRLTFVPSLQAVPYETSLFRMVEAVPSQPLNAARKKVPLVAFLQASSQGSRSFSRLLDLLRMDPDNPEISPLLKELLPCGAPFRAALESLSPPPATLYGWLVRDPDWLVQFRQAGDGVAHEAVCAAVHADPAGRFSAAVDGASRCSDDNLVLRLYEELARSLARRVWPDSLAAMALQRREHFLQVVRDPKRIDDRTLVDLADRLDELPAYSGEAHQIAIGRLLGGFTEGPRHATIERWAAILAHQREDSTWRAIAGLVAWSDAGSWSRPDFRLERYPSLSGPLYRSLLSAIWPLDISPRDFVVIGYNQGHRRAFLDFCAQQLPRTSVETAFSLLRSITELCVPTSAEHGQFVDAAGSHRDRYELAQSYIGLLSRLRPLEGDAISRLRGIPKPRSRWSF